MTKTINNISYYLIIFLTLLTPIFFLDRVILSVYHFDLLKFEYYNVLWILSPALLFTYIYNLIKKEIKLNVFDCLVFIFLFLNIFVCIFSVDLETSIFGYEYRNEGYISYFTYYLIFLNCKNICNEKRINNLLKLLLTIGVFQFFYGFLQIYFKDLVHPNLIYGFTPNMASGFIYNPNFLGSYIVILLGIVVTKFLTNNNKYTLYLLLSIIFFMNLIFTQSTGPFLGFVTMYIFLTIFLIIKKSLKIRRFIILTTSLLICYFLTNYTMYINPNISNYDIIKEYTINYDIKQMIRALKGELRIKKENSTKKNNNVIDTNIQSSTQIIEKVPDIVPREDDLDYLGSRRFFIWRKSLTLVPKYFWFGSGIDTFGMVYKWHDSANYYDKAHNVYLQILITQGIFVLITYLLFLSLLVVKAIRSNNRLAWTLLMSFIGYSVQSFTNISVVEVAPYFYMIAGLMLGATNIKKENKIKNIVISGCYGSSNSGDDAVLFCLIKQIKKLNKEVNITVLSLNPKKTKKQFSVDTIYSFDIIKYNRKLNDCDVFISGGGTLLQNTTSNRSLLYYLYTIISAKRNNCKVVLFGCGIGPIKGKIMKKITSKVLNKYADSILVRDYFSYNELKGLKVKYDNVYVGIDPSLLLTEYIYIDNKALDKLKISNKKKYAIIAIKKTYKVINDEIIQVSNYLYKKGIETILLPMNYKEDLRLLKQISSQISNNHILIDEDISFEEKYNLIKNSELVIGMRLHAILFAYLNEVKVIGLSYDPKIDGFCNDYKITRLIKLNDFSYKKFVSEYKKVKSIKVDYEKINKLNENNEKLLSEHLNKF